MPRLFKIPFLREHDLWNSKNKLFRPLNNPPLCLFLIYAPLLPTYGEKKVPAYFLVVYWFWLRIFQNVEVSPRISFSSLTGGADSDYSWIVFVSKLKLGKFHHCGAFLFNFLS